MTNDGELIDSMMRGSAGHEKEYIVRVKKKISDADLERLRKGVRLKELEVTTRPCKVERLGDHTFRIILTSIFCGFISLAAEPGLTVPGYIIRRPTTLTFNWLKRER